MPLNVGTVLGYLDLKDQWTATLQKAADNTQAFEKQTTAAMTNAAAASERMSGAALSVQGRLAIAEAAAGSIRKEISTLAAAIVDAGGASDVQKNRLNDLTGSLTRVEGAAKGFRGSLGDLAKSGGEVENVGK